MFEVIANIGLPFIPGGGDLRPLAAEIWLILTLVALLVAPFFVSRPRALCGMISLTGLLGGLVSLLAMGPQSPGSFTALQPMLVNDPAAFFWKVLLFLFVMGVILLWFATTAGAMHPSDGPEFFTLLIGATLGMSLMASAANLLMIFMAVELASLPGYILAGFRKTDRVGAEASLKYVLFGATSTAIMAYGLSVLYGLYGTLSLYATPAGPGLAQLMSQSGAGDGALLVIGFFGLMVGLGFKIAAAPFHFWCPDVFEGASIDVSAFLSVASKGAALMLLIRVLEAIAGGAHFQSSPRLIAIATAVGVLGAMTAIVGNAGALLQTNVKRLLAYSSIAHAGYMLCALSPIIRARPGVDPSAAPVQALLVYLAVYLFMNLGAFTVAGLVARETESEDIAAFSGLGRRSPLLALCMTASLLSLIGLPPLAGFAAKLNIMYLLGSNGGWWWILVGVIAVNTIVSLYYYARILKAMYLMDTPALQLPFAFPVLGSALSLACAIMLVAMLLGFGMLSRLASTYAAFTDGTHPVAVTSSTLSR